MRIALSESGVPFAEDAIPQVTARPGLDVDVRCDEIGLHAVQRISLPTADATLPSTVAVFVPDRRRGPLTLRMAVLHGAGSYRPRRWWRRAATAVPATGSNWSAAAVVVAQAVAGTLAAASRLDSRSPAASSTAAPRRPVPALSS